MCLRNGLPDYLSNIHFQYCCFSWFHFWRFRVDSSHMPDKKHSHWSLSWWVHLQRYHSWYHSHQSVLRFQVWLSPHSDTLHFEPSDQTLCQLSWCPSFFWTLLYQKTIQQVSTSDGMLVSFDHTLVPARCGSRLLRASGICTTSLAFRFSLRREFETCFASLLWCLGWWPLALDPCSTRNFPASWAPAHVHRSLGRSSSRRLAAKLALCLGSECLEHEKSWEE